MTHQTKAIAPPIPHFPCPSTWDIAQIELNAYIQQQADEVSPEIDVDSLQSAANSTYRVWFDTKHLGNFWQSRVTGNWISEAYCRKNKKRFHSPQEAQQAIISAWNLN